MTLDRLQHEVATWATKNFPNAKPYQPLLGVAEECGELCRAHLKSEQGIRGTPKKHHRSKVDAIGDILIFLAHYCQLNGINMHAALVKTWREVAMRNWVENPNNGGVE